VKLNYGCGLDTAGGWLNCDSSVTLRAQRLPLVGAVFRRALKPRFPEEVQFGDIVRGLDIAPDSCDAIFCSHVLEHLALEDCRKALRNTHAYLEPSGTFRLIVPDLEQLVASYLSNSEPPAASNFMTYTHLGRKSRPKGLLGHLGEYLGSTHHLWMWDYKGLASELETVGFKGIRRCQNGDSTNPAFREVELAERYEWGLGIEASK